MFPLGYRDAKLWEGENIYSKTFHMICLCCPCKLCVFFKVQQFRYLLRNLPWFWHFFFSVDNLVECGSFQADCRAVSGSLSSQLGRFLLTSCFMSTSQQERMEMSRWYIYTDIKFSPQLISHVCTHARTGQDLTCSDNTANINQKCRGLLAGQ